MQQRLPFHATRAAASGALAGLFHPAVARWFADAFGEPTPVQREAWARTARHANVLIAAPTGSGKTLAAFLAAINDLVVAGLEQRLQDRVHVLYVSPLKALSNDILKNLQQPLAGIRAQLNALNLEDVPIRDAVRTGDTTTVERGRQRRTPPHILVTTPESLFILLGSDSGRAMLAGTRTVIVDELHAVAGSKRGAHLALSLERLDALCATPPVRIGLSATQKPIETMARLLMGAADRHCEIVDTGHHRARDIALELPRSPLTPVMANEVWTEIYDRIAELVSAHRTTLIFVNQRRMAERAARHLAERLGDEHVTAHHGSLAREHRLRAEQRLKNGSLRALVATASLELGIDIGDVDLVIQIGSPRSINAFLQRVGRAGHAVGAIPKGRLFPQSLDDLAECAALIDCVQRGELDRIHIPQQPLDVLAQQVVSELACREWGLEELHQHCCRALAFRELSLERFEVLVRMLADGYATKRGRRGALVHYDAVNRRLRGRRGARLVALSNAGTIPDQFDYDVVLAPEDLRIGTLNEDFAFESLPGDIVQLGNTSYRINKIETGRVFVEDAKGQPPTMPFWFGEAPARTAELSAAVSRLREQANKLLGENDLAECIEWLKRDYGLDGVAAAQLGAYLASSQAALGTLPTLERIVFERFFDEVGDTHLVIHSPRGARINRAWGLALRKRFCRQFNFELQAAALDDSIVLSLGPTHSFPLEDVKHFLNANTARDVLVQAVLQAPMFGTRWRWAASVALAVSRNRNGKRVPPQFQRADAEDLLTHAFPDALACQDNLPGDREVPDHPLVQQAIEDCLHEVMDIDGFIQLLRDIESGAIEIVCRDLTTPSPLCGSILSARPYAFLDDGAAEERRTLAVKQRSLPEAQSSADLGRLDPRAIARVRMELAPDPRDADELHDSLVIGGFLTSTELQPWTAWLEPLQQARRVVALDAGGDEQLWVAAERLQQARALWSAARVEGDAPALGPECDSDTALLEMLRSRLEMFGPVTAAELARPMALAPRAVEAALLMLEAQGGVMRGDFERIGAEQWCERRRLARIHRYTRESKRAAVETVPPAALMRFLLHWQGVTASERRSGPVALEAVLAQLEGFPVAAAAWESEILPARLRGYAGAWLDQLCATGRIVWQRPPQPASEGRKAAPVRATPVALLAREHAAYWQAEADAEPELSSAAVAVLDALDRHGASFFVELVEDSTQLRTQVEGALGELVSHGLVSSDGFAGLRALIAPAEVKARSLRRGGVRAALQGLEGAGRWSRVRRRGATVADADAGTRNAQLEFIARTLLRRYGVVFRALLEREPRLPPWRDLFYVLRRLEARDEIRGGRFVSGFAGEQFALPEAAAALLREREDRDGALAVIAATDPLNFTGILLPGERVAAIVGHRILLRGGVPVATLVAGEIHCLADAEPGTQLDWRARLLRGPSWPEDAEVRPVAATALAL